jgi:chromosome segregation ATPase
MDAPAARRQLLQNKKQLTDVSEKFEKTKLELVSLADKVKDVESAASARQAELRMQNGALTAAEQVLSANCETLKAEREAARLELDAARAKIGTLVAKVTELADAKEIATASDTKPQEDKKPKTE